MRSGTTDVLTMRKTCSACDPLTTFPKSWLTPLGNVFCNSVRWSLEAFGIGAGAGPEQAASGPDPDTDEEKCEAVHGDLPGLCSSVRTKPRSRTEENEGP